MAVLAGVSRANLLEDIEPEVRLALRQLHRRDPRRNWICAFYPAMWLSSVILMHRFPQWPVQGFGMVVIGVSIQAMAILMHEALHGNLFRDRARDRWAAFVFAIPAFFSGTAYSVTHLNHHRYTRTEKDQDEIANRCRTRARYRTLLYVRYFLGTFLYFFLVPVKALALATPNARRRIWAEYVAMFCLYTAVTVTLVTAGHGTWVLWYWLLPAQIATLLSNVRANAEHVGTGIGSAILISRTITSNRLVSFLMCNLNYHLEHHLFPGIPWYNLPAAHKLLRSTYTRAGAHVERSYVRHTISALCGTLEMVHREPLATTSREFGEQYSVGRKSS
jgi:fatty acid desaturase